MTRITRWCQSTSEPYRGASHHYLILSVWFFLHLFPTIASHHGQTENTTALGLFIQPTSTVRPDTAGATIQDCNSIWRYTKRIVEWATSFQDTFSTTSEINRMHSKVSEISPRFIATASELLCSHFSRLIYSVPFISTALTTFTIFLLSPVAVQMYSSLVRCF